MTDNNRAKLFVIEGKRRQSAVFPETLCLSHENPAKLKGLMADWEAKLQPRDAVELAMAHQVATCWWRLQRAQAMESALISDSPSRLLNGDTSMKAISAYEGRMRRYFEQSLTNFFRLRDAAGTPSDEPRPGRQGRLRLVA